MYTYAYIYIYIYVYIIYIYIYIYPPQVNSNCYSLAPGKSSLLRPGDRLLDVGAHVGTASALALRTPRVEVVGKSGGKGWETAGKMEEMVGKCWENDGNT